jgi:hypothetical protein
MRLKSPSGICVDCGRPAYFSRCEFCRCKHQREVEEAFTKPSMSALACTLPTRNGACREILTFGCDRLGRTTTYCYVHGEHLMPTVGVRQYDQRVVLDEETEESVERASKPPEQRYVGRVAGQHWRQKSYEYVRSA